MNTLNDTIFLLSIILCIVIVLKYKIDLKRRSSINLNAIKNAISTIDPTSSVVKITINENKRIQFLCLNSQGKWFKVESNDEKKLEFSAINTNEVVTILTKIS